MMTRWTIKSRLLALAALGVAMSLLLGGVALRGLRQVTSTTREIATAGTAQLNHLQGDMMHDALRGDVLAVLLARNPGEIAAVATDYREHAAWFRRVLDANAKLPLGPEVRRAIDDVRPSVQTYIDSAGAIVGTAATDQAGARAALPAFLVSFGELETRLEAVSTLIEGANASAAAHASDVERRSSLMMASVCGLGALLVLAFSGMIVRSVVAPLDAVVRAMDDIANGEGDLTRRLNVRSRDEIGRLSDAFDRFLGGMQVIIASVRESAVHVNAASHELSQASTDISATAQQQASSIEETAASLEQMTSSVRQNADHAALASRLAGGARDVADAGGRTVTKAVTAMKELNHSSSRIADIITTINEIAFQTNLLALNAAVEAARAGELGRGFAVVAAEVRQLAQRSAGAAREIKELIDDSVRKVETGSALVDESGRTLGEIVTAVARVSDLITEIAAASREQATGIDQVNVAMGQMDLVTQANATRTEELSGTAQSMAAQSSQLQALVSRFRLDDRAATMTVAGGRSRHAAHAPARRDAA